MVELLVYKVLERRELPVVAHEAVRVQIGALQHELDDVVMAVQALTRVAFGEVVEPVARGEGALLMMVYITTPGTQDLEPRASSKAFSLVAGAAKAA